jgi:hypothetical protein
VAFGLTTLESTVKDAEREFRTNPDFRDWFHRNYKPDVVGDDGKTKNPSPTPEEIRDAHEEWTEAGCSKRK